MRFQAPVNPFTVPRKGLRWTPLRTRRSAYRYVVAVEPCEPMPMRCIAVDSPDHSYLAGVEMIPTHNTELATQLVMAVAGSVHPFTGQPTEHSEPRVLIVDCENSTTQSRRRFRRIAGAVDSARAMWEAPAVAWGKRVKVEFRPGGIDLLAPSDVAWLESVISTVSPDLVAMGPLYKLHNGNINDGEMAGALLRTIDRLRERHQFALITEAHASKAQGANGERSMEPEGSALFLRWPEFGMGLRRNKDNPMEQADVAFWRGSREERAWPEVLHRRHTGLLPWGPDGDYYQQLEGFAHLTADQMTIR
jgi:replicative DNA helicase